MHNKQISNSDRCCLCIKKTITITCLRAGLLHGRTGCEPRVVSGGFPSTGSGFRALTSHKNEQACCEPKMVSGWLQDFSDARKVGFVR